MAGAGFRLRRIPAWHSTTCPVDRHSNTPHVITCADRRAPLGSVNFGYLGRFGPTMNINEPLVSMTVLPRDRKGFELSALTERNSLSHWQQLETSRVLRNDRSRTYEKDMKNFQRRPEAPSHPLRLTNSGETLRQPVLRWKN